MVSSYKKILAVNVYHTFYKDGLCKDVIYQPTAKTKNIFDRYGLKLKNSTTGFDLYLPSNLVLHSFLEYISRATPQTSFNFEIVTNTPQFYEFTNWPVNKDGYYFCSSSNVQMKEESKEFVKVFKPQNSSKIVSEIEVRFQDFKETSKAIFSLQFESRITEWNYLIVNQSNRYFEKLQIEGSTQIKFSDPETIILENGEKAISFVSNSSEIALHEIPQYKFNLTGIISNNGVKRTQIIYKGLPTPNLSIIKLIKEGKKNTVRSLMYVYI